MEDLASSWASQADPRDKSDRTVVEPGVSKEDPRRVVLHGREGPLSAPPGPTTPLPVQSRPAMQPLRPTWYPQVEEWQAKNGPRRISLVNN